MKTELQKISPDNTHSKESGTKVTTSLEHSLHTSLKSVLKLEQSCFPQDWQYDDAEEYYSTMLLDVHNINLFLEEDNTIVGYILATPHSHAFEELKEDDLLLEPRKNCFYIETIGVLPEYQGNGGAKKLLVGVCAEAQKKGVTHFSIHARTVNGFNELVKKLFKESITLVRPIESWVHASGEPYEYIEWHV